MVYSIEYTRNHVLNHPPYIIYQLFSIVISDLVWMCVYLIYFFDQNWVKWYNNEKIIEWYFCNLTTTKIILQVKYNKG